jgi:hypothetical protein
MRFAAIIGLFVGVFWVGTAFMAWIRYPDCGPDHVAALAFYNTNTLWVCARGFDPPWPKRSEH